MLAHDFRFLVCVYVQAAPYLIIALVATLKCCIPEIAITGGAFEKGNMM